MGDVKMKMTEEKIYVYKSSSDFWIVNDKRLMYKRRMQIAKSWDEVIKLARWWATEDDIKWLI